MGRHHSDSSKSSHRRTKHHHDKKRCDNCPESNGYIYRGYGPNLTSGGNVFFLGAMFDRHGCDVGRVSAASDSENGPVTNIFHLHDGSKLEVLLNKQSTLVSMFPVDELTVQCFPEVAQYLNDPNAKVMITSCNHTKRKDSNVLSWKGRCLFKKANVLQVRCAFLLLNDKIHEQLGCQWFIGTSK